MNIRANFNRLAAGIGLGLTLAWTPPADAQPIVPPGANPPHLQQFYQRLISNSNVPNAAQVRIHSSITQLTSTPLNDWLQNLKDMTPEAAEAEVQNCLSSLCEYKYIMLNDTERFIGQLMVIEAMFHNGLNEQEFRTYSEFISNFQPSAEFNENDDMIINGIVDRIVNSVEYNQIKRNILPAAQINTRNAEQQFHIRQNFIRLVTHEIRSHYQKPPASSHLDIFPSNLNGTGAVTLSRPGHPELETNRGVLYNYNASNMHTVDQLLEIAAHESRHTIDFDDRESALATWMPHSDVRFKHTAVIHLNQNMYIPLCATRSFGAVSCPQQYEWYRNQYVERSAQKFAEKVLIKFREKVRAQEYINRSSSLKTHKLQLPA